MENKQEGFTLIELIVVIVILGILAATALPKFIDLSGDANEAATKGVAGAVSSAFAINYGARAANSTKGVQITGATVDVTAAAGSIMVGGFPTSGYTVTPSTANCGTVAGAAAGSGISLTVTGGKGTSGSAVTASAMLVCTG